jgi:sugar-phosphatase
LTTTSHYAAFLFDMDGTLLTSIAAAERVWTRWAHAHGLDAEAFVPTIHGARAIDTVRRVATPGMDAEAEAARITAWELEDTIGVEAIAGAAAFTASLPPQAWAIVTSAPRELAVRRLQAAGLPPAPVMVTAEDVERGKPDPSGYQLAAARLGVEAAHCLVFEDAPAGIGAAEAAGADVLVITATHAGYVHTPHRSARDFLALQATAGTDGLHLHDRTR